MELRLYTFCNFYLSQIQGGIQSAHLVHELYNKYLGHDGDDVDSLQMLIDWSRNHKTIIVLNGGPNEYLRTRWMMLQRELNTIELEISHKLPWSSFNEDEFSLGGVMTVVGVVLPECIYNAVDYRTAINIVSDARAFSNTYDVNQREGSYFWLQGLDSNPYVARHYKPRTEAARLIADVKSCKLF